MVERLEGAHRGSANCDYAAGKGGKLFEERQRHSEKFGVHGVVAYTFTFYGLKSPGTNVERQFAALDATGGDFLQYFVGKM
jgi:hypothetical protein